MPFILFFLFPALVISCSMEEMSTMLKIENFNFSLKETDLYKMSFSVEHSNVSNIYYNLECLESPNDYVPDEFFKRGDNRIFLSNENDPEDADLTDNGEKDEDQSENKIAYSLETKDWAPGKYRFAARVIAEGPGESRMQDEERFEFLLMESNEPIDVSISISDFRLDQISESVVRVSFAASSEDGVVGSYVVRMHDSPDEYIPPQFYLQSNSGFYFLSDEVDKNVFVLPENGHVDEDPEVGRFAYTFDMTDWAIGQYTFYVGAQNRPQEGPYIGNGNYIRIGNEKQPEDYANVDHQIIYQREGEYSVFPSLAEQIDGSLALSFSTRSVRSHIDNTGGNVQMVSYDEGNSWSNATARIIDKMWQTDNGFLVNPAAGGWVRVPDTEYTRLRNEGKYIQDVNPGTIAYYGNSYVKKSYDNGASWSREDIPLPSYCNGTMNYLARASLIRTFKGTILQTVYGVRADHTTSSGHSNWLEVFLHRSEDDGETWEGYAMYPEGLPEAGIGFDESTIEQAADGTIIMLMRSSAENYLWQATSDDEGKTWSQPVKTEIYGYPAHLKRLNDGRLLCAYGYRVLPMGIRAVLSYDNGKTWDVDNTIVVRSDGDRNPSDLGYPLIYERSDGKILLTYYFTTTELDTHIASSILELP